MHSLPSAFRFNLSFLAALHALLTYALYRGYKARRVRLLLVEALDGAAQKIQAYWRSQRDRNRFLDKRDVGVLVLADKLLRNLVSEA